MISRRPDDPGEFLPRHGEAFRDPVETLGNIAGDDQPVLRMGLERREGGAVDRMGEMQVGNGEQAHDRTITRFRAWFPRASLPDDTLPRGGFGDLVMPGGGVSVCTGRFMR